tara:strand:- start:820 stop:963 length:144 start_codon:yes stop_codon:yes gene_type:complete
MINKIRGGVEPSDVFGQGCVIPPFITPLINVLDNCLVVSSIESTYFG